MPTNNQPPRKDEFFEFLSSLTLEYHYSRRNNVFSLIETWAKKLSYFSKSGVYHKLASHTEMIAAALWQEFSRNEVNRFIYTLAKDEKDLDIKTVYAYLLLSINYGNRLEKGGSEQKDEHARKEGHYKYISANTDAFLTQVHSLLQMYPDKKHFVDIGSGIGTKLLLAATLFSFTQVTGIEYTTQTHHIAKYILGKTSIGKRFKYLTEDRVNLINEDALNVNLAALGIDFVYYYHPISGPKIVNLYKATFENSAVGTVFLEMMPYRSQQEEFIRDLNVIQEDNDRIIVYNAWEKIGKDSIKLFRVRKLR